MLKKFIFFLTILTFLTSCTDFRAEQKSIKLQKEKELTEQQRADDFATCKYYGFKENTSSFSDCLMNLDLARKPVALLWLLSRLTASHSNIFLVNISCFWAGVLMGARENLACD